MEDLIHLQYLGQAGFVVETKTQKFVIDPYLSNYVVEGGIGSAEMFSREFPVPVQPDQLRGLQLAFITHDHADHCDPLTLVPLLKSNPEMLVIGTRTVADHLISEGVSAEKIIVPELDKLYDIKGTRFYTVPAAHYDFGKNEKGELAYFGFVIEVNGQWMYHSGDTILYDGMVESILRHTDQIRVACLPINGRDGWRERMGMTGNLDAAETLQLAKLIKADVILPMHNDLFKVNHVNPSVFVDIADRIAPRQKYHWLQPGEDFYLK
ncbi:MAG: MBL fold metallo-hydrolase [Anaerolineaceae bacterium]|nr:MBL fold metallo-hydrolase [Anaerolineaceae bacterium]